MQIPKLSLIFEFDEEVAEIIDNGKDEQKTQLCRHHNLFATFGYSETLLCKVSA